MTAYGVFTADRTGRLGDWHLTWDEALRAAGELARTAGGNLCVRSRDDPAFNTLPDLHADALGEVRRRALNYFTMQSMTVRKRYLRQTLLNKACQRAYALGIARETVQRVTVEAQTEARA